MSKKTTFNCDHCGNEKTVWTKQYTRNKNHFCQRSCKDAHGKTITDRKTYEKEYWSKPENALRRKVMSRAAHLARRNNSVDSVKREMVKRAKARSAKSGTPFNITHEDFEIPDKCPALGILLITHDVQGGWAGSPSLDRIIPDLGYVRGNVRVISKRANSIKSDATFEEVQKVADFMKSFCQPEDQQD